jgi:DMSO/TMAO reductase YedYZ molybdopterin-dependent catalytic subunit
MQTSPPLTPLEPAPPARPATAGRLLAALSGVVAAGVALGVAELLAGTTRSWRSPVLDVGDRVIDAAPPFVKDFAIETFGENDKPALLVGIGVLLALYSLAVGFLALRRRFAYGIVGVAAFAAVGAWAATSRRAGGSIAAAIPSIVGALAGIGALWLILRSVRRSPAAGAVDPTGRRELLRQSGLVLGGLAAAAAVAGTAGRWLGRRFDAASSRAAVVLPRPDKPAPQLPATTQVDAPGMTPFVTPNAEFYRVDTALTVPQLAAEDYTLRVVGMVDNELELSYADLLGRELIERDITLTCVSNQVGGTYVGNARWLGARLTDVLEEAGVQRDADQIVGRSVDGWACGFPVGNALDGRDALLAVGMNGEPLPLEHGFPVRLVVPGLYGFVSATKWLTEIEITTFAEFDHYWLRRGWAQKAPIKTMSRIDTPRGLAKVSAGPIVVAGVAWAQTRGISKVEVRVDDGPWQRAELADAPSSDTWRQWSYRFDVESGRRSIAVRATDGTGEVQTEQRAEPIPDGASGHHQIVVLVE